MSDWIITKVPQNDLTELARRMGLSPVPAHVAVGCAGYPTEGPTFDSMDEVERFIGELRTVAAEAFGSQRPRQDSNLQPPG